jgi:site-specific DNA recombinase
MIAAIYSRKSKFTGKGESTQNQIQLCEQYAKDHFNVNGIMIYEDEGFSGVNSHRPEFQKMLKDAKEKRFNILISYRLDRISRNISDFSNLIELLQNKNIGFVSIREQFDTSTPMGRAMMYIASVFAQLERETIAERIRDNMLGLAKTGRWLGGNPPTGFRSESILYLNSNMKEKRMYKLTPVTEELELVKLLFKKYLEFQSLSKLETYCIQNYIKTKNEKNFYKYSLRNILTNPVYAEADQYAYKYFEVNNSQIACSKKEFTGEYGIMAYNKNLVVKGKSNKTKAMDEWIIAIGKHKGIISGKDWVKVQEIITKNKALAPRRNTSQIALLSNFLRCSKCGSFMKIKYGQLKVGTDTRHYYYVCNSKEISKGKLCNNKNLTGEKIDTEVIRALSRKMKPGSINALDKIKKNMQKKNHQNIIAADRIKENKKSINTLLKQLYYNDNPNVSQYIFNEIEKLDKEISDMESNIKNYNAEIKSFNINILQDIIIDFTRSVDISSLEEKKKFLNNIVDKINWDGKELNIILL